MSSFIKQIKVHMQFKKVIKKKITIKFTEKTCESCDLYTLLLKSMCLAIWLKIITT